MAAGLPIDKLPLEVRLSLGGEDAIDHRPIATILAVPREIRHAALTTIFDEMGLTTRPRRREALRNLGHLMFDYRRLRSSLRVGFETHADCPMRRTRSMTEAA